MKPHPLQPLPPRTALRALRLFLTECSLDRTRHSLPLRELTDSDEIPDFHDSLEEMMRALLLDYSLELRARIIKASLRRELRDRHFH
jgi:hypothetical protein